MQEPFASYKTESVVTVVTQIHRVRIKIGTSAGQLMDAIRNVPPGATVHEVIGDCDHESFTACGEIVLKTDEETG